MMKTVKEHNIKADDLAEIKVEVIARAADILGDPHKHRPDSKETADHSLPYCMRLRQIHPDHRRKIIPLPPAQSRRSGIDRRRRRRESRGRAAPREGVDLTAVA